MFDIVVACVGLLIGLTKGGFQGLGPLLTPLLSLALPVSTAVGVLLPMLMVGDALAIYMYWREWDGALTWRMLPFGIVGVWGGTWLLAVLPANALRISLAVFVLLVVAYKIASDAIASMRYEPRRWHAPAVGTVTGVASGMFNHGGGPFNSYLLLQKLPPRRFIATAALFFALLNCLKLPSFLVAGVLDVHLLVSLWWVFPFVIAGMIAARLLVVRVDPRSFEWIIIVLLVGSSALLLGQAL